MSYYDYEELRAAAFAPNATQEDVENLGDWFSQYGEAFWNGECYDADGYELWPVYDFSDEDDPKLTGYEIR